MTAKQAPVVVDRDKLAEAMCKWHDDESWNPTEGTCFACIHLADHLIESGAVTTLPDALRKLADDDAQAMAPAFVAYWRSLGNSFALARNALHVLADAIESK